MATITTEHCDLCHRDVTHRSPNKFAGVLKLVTIKGVPGQPDPEREYGICRECLEALNKSILNMRQHRAPRVEDRVEPPNV